MRRLFLRIFEYLSSHKAVAALLLSVLMALCALSALRLDYQEDISAFLPRDAQSEKYYDTYQKLGGASRVAVFFHDKSEGGADVIKDAMDRFETVWAGSEGGALVPSLSALSVGGNIDAVFDFISTNWPYFATDEDYARIDSLLSADGFIRSRMDQNRLALLSPSPSIATRYMRRDPLGLFAPVLQRLESLNPGSDAFTEDGYLFTSEGGDGVIFFNSPYGGGESGNNAVLSSALKQVISTVEAEYPDIEVFATGGPLVAVENASRIKADSLIALAVAFILILLVLYLSFKRFADVFWTGVTVLCGLVFALGLIALFRPSISIIILGIGSIIIGIAVNYPLHYVDHLKYRPVPAQALSDQIEPLLIGNITTVAAFASLLLLKSQAMRDFGFVGAALLVGTILFTLVFLPIFVPVAKRPRNTLKLDFDRGIHIPRKWQTPLILLFTAVTVLLFFKGRNVTFEADMHGINYMTKDQARGFALLENMGRSHNGESVLVVAQGDDQQVVMQDYEAVASLSDSLGCPYVSLAPFLPSAEVQGHRLAKWNAFKASHPDLSERLRAAASEAGFTASVFDDFQSLLSKDFIPQELEWFSPIVEGVGGATFLKDGKELSLVTYLYSQGAETEVLKQRVRDSVPDGVFCFDASDTGSNLVSVLSDDFDKIGFICSIVVFIFLCLTFRKLELSVMAFLPLALAWVWILGIMNIFGIHFNIVNIILATFIFGQGDDYTIFITEGLLYEYSTGKKILRSYKNCVMLSALIMFIGIGALILARHPAMRSLSQVTIIGMFAVVVMAYYIPPFFFGLLTRRKGVERELPLTLGSLARTFIMLLTALVAMLILNPLALLYFALGGNTKKGKQLYHKAICAIARAALKCLPGCSFALDNPTGESFDAPAVIVCNHQSHLDILSMLALNPRIALMCNDWVWKNPAYAYLIRKAGFIPISEGYDRNLERVRALVADGYSVAVYPEGTRSPDCKIQRFHRGAFQMAAQLGLDVLPVYIHGFGTALPKTDLSLRRGQLYMRVGQRIPSSAFAEDIRAYTKELRASYIQTLAAISSERQNAAWYVPYVRTRYYYRGSDAAKECASYLKGEYLSKADSLEGDRILIRNSGCGVYPLLLALTHPDKTITSYEPDRLKAEIALKLPYLPDNLVFAEQDPEGMYDTVIEL